MLFIGVGTLLIITCLIKPSIQVDIYSYDEPRCPSQVPWEFRCMNHMQNVCCVFGPTRATSTVSVKYTGLGSGDIATWFHKTRLPLPYHACGSLRKLQAMVGSGPGELCMNLDNPLSAESDDGANWRSSDSNRVKNPSVMYAEHGFFAIIGGNKLSNPVAARNVPLDHSVESKCLARRYASRYARQDGSDETGTWILHGSEDNNKKYSDLKARHPEKTPVELIQLAGGVYKDRTAHSDRRSYKDMIATGELEENEYTLHLAAEEARGTSLAVREYVASHADNFPWIRTRNDGNILDENNEADEATGSISHVEAKREDDTAVRDSFPWIGARDDTTTTTATDGETDSFPWIKARDIENTMDDNNEADEATGAISHLQGKRDAVADEADSFPWIKPRNDNGELDDNNEADEATGHVSALENKRDENVALTANADTTTVADSFPWIG